MRNGVLLPILVAVSLLLMPSSAAVGADTPCQALALWYDAMQEIPDMPDGRLVDTVSEFYTAELQDQFKPDVDPIAGKQDEWRSDKALKVAADLHRQWAAFLAKSGFTRQDFESGDESFHEDTATVIVRSSSNVSRSFDLENVAGRGWVISKLGSPDAFSATVRLLLIIAAIAVVVGIIAKKLVFA